MRDIARTRAKSALYYLLYKAHVFEATLAYRRRRGHAFPCIVLLYHRIIDNNSLILRKGLSVHHPVDDFAREMAYLRKYYKVISLDTFVEHMETRRPLLAPTVAITFDDGYRDNYFNAFPVLKKHGFPAIIYLTTSVIGTSDRLWTDTIENALIRTNMTSLVFPPLLGSSSLSLETLLDKMATNIRIAEELKRRPDEERRKLIKDLTGALVSERPVQGRTEPRVMLSWEEVSEMANHATTFGSHTHTHPILTKLPIEAAKSEISISKGLIEEKLGTGVHHFAFPNGRLEDFSDELREHCTRVGFRSIASAIYGVNGVSDGDVRNIKRVGAATPIWRFAGNLFIEILKFQRTNGC